VGGEAANRAFEGVYSDAKVATLGISGGRSLAHGAVTRRPPISIYTMVARTWGYAYAATVWDLSIVQGPVSVSVVRATPSCYDSQLLHRLYGE
jgi:hypothetical protein